MHASPRKVVNRAVTPAVQRAGVPAQAAVAASARAGGGVVQAAGSLRISSPSDPAEREAERVASRVMGLPDREVAAPSPTGRPPRSPHVARLAGCIAQRPAALARKAEGMPNVAAN